MLFPLWTAIIEVTCSSWRQILGYLTAEGHRRVCNQTRKSISNINQEKLHRLYSSSICFVTSSMDITYQALLSVCGCGFVTVCACTNKLLVEGPCYMPGLLPTMPLSALSLKTDKWTEWSLLTESWQGPFYRRYLTYVLNIRKCGYHSKEVHVHSLKSHQVQCFMGVSSIHPLVPTPYFRLNFLYRHRRWHQTL